MTLPHGRHRLNPTDAVHIVDAEPLPSPQPSRRVFLVPALLPARPRPLTVIARPPHLSRAPPSRPLPDPSDVGVGRHPARPPQLSRAPPSRPLPDPPGVGVGRQPARPPRLCSTQASRPLPDPPGVGVGRQPARPSRLCYAQACRPLPHPLGVGVGRQLLCPRGPVLRYGRQHSVHVQLTQTVKLGRPPCVTESAWGVHFGRAVFGRRLTVSGGEHFGRAVYGRAVGVADDGCHPVDARPIGDRL